MQEIEDEAVLAAAEARALSTPVAHEEVLASEEAKE
jgi:hypothetical protein